MIVLGLWDGHDAGAALVADGQLLCAISEERLTRQKRAAGFPVRALQAVLSDAGLRPEQVQHVAVAGRGGRLPHRALDAVYRAAPPNRDPLSLASHLARGYEDGVAQRPPLAALDGAAAQAVLARRLRALGLGGAQLTRVDHHTAHAATARLVARADAAIVTMDGYGDGVCASFQPAGGAITRLLSPGDSLALIYGATSRLLGFGEGEEGKVTGLAATGDPALLRDAFMAVSAPGQCMPRLTPALRQRVAAHRRQDVAAALQEVTQRRVVELVRRHLPHATELAVAGGLFANVLLNGHLRDAVGALEVFPAMGDAGLPVGAAVAVAGPVPFGVPHLGPALSDADVSAALANSGLPATRHPQPERALAQALLAGQTVARVFGRSEFGPRALGHRSILVRADDAGRLAALNQLLARDEFMPFAPLRRSGAGTPTMTQVFQADEVLRQRCAGVVHVDGTVRTQRLDAASDPRLDALLSELEAAGLPAVVNTSFNRHGEPIVESAEDALRTFKATSMDLMQVGDWLVTRPGGSFDHRGP